MKIEKVVCFPIGPVPGALFDEFGAMRKTTKSDLGKKLEKEVEESVVFGQLPQFARERTVYIRDAMCLIQCITPANGSTYNGIANDYNAGVMHSFAKGNTVIDVFDRYDNENSTKTVERERREIESKRVYQVVGGRVAPPWKKFLCAAENKSSFNNFLGEALEKLAPGKLSPNQAYFVAGPYREGTMT